MSKYIKTRDIVIQLSLTELLEYNDFRDITVFEGFLKEEVENKLADDGEEVSVEIKNYSFYDGIVENGQAPILVSFVVKY